MNDYPPRGFYEAEYMNPHQKRINRVVFGRERIIWLPGSDPLSDPVPMELN